MTTLDSKQYKEEERQNWDRVANNWQKWWKTIERGAEKVSRRLIDLAEIKSGSKVLDIATGIGEPAITAANEVGSSGHVLATDISPQMLSVAKQRAISLGLQNVIEFKEGDIETIDLPSSAFDAVLCRWGLMFLPDLKVGLSNIYQSLLNDGHFAAAVWASLAQDTLLATTMNIIMKETHTHNPPHPGTPGPFSLSDENILMNSFTMSGFKDINIERMKVAFDFNSPEDFTTFTSETAGPLQKVLASQTKERKEEILKAVTEAAKKYVDKNTRIVKFENEAILIVGKKWIIPSPNGCSMKSDETLPPEKIAFIAYNIGVYESVQKFGQLITSGKITNNIDASKVAELLSESIAFYDAEMISGLINTMLRHTNNNTINNVTADEVRNVMNQLKAVGVSIPWMPQPIFPEFSDSACVIPSSCEGCKQIVYVFTVKDISNLGNSFRIGLALNEHYRY